jgi:small subunit ribosomal protein S16
MSVRIRLQRHGKKGKPFYWIVAADARSKRDGRFLEKLGIYNPNTNPATIELNLDSSVRWLHNGAQPSDTARAILSYKGALLKHHLEVGVNKGALTTEQAEAKLQAWIEEKAARINAKKDSLSQDKAEVKAAALKAEKAVNEKRMAAAADAARAAEAEAVVETAVEEAPEVAVEETVVAEAAPEVAVEETVVAEAAPEVVAEEPAAEAATEEGTTEA